MFGFRKNKKKPSVCIDKEVAVPETELEPESPEPAVETRQFWNSNLSEADWVSEMFNKQLQSGAFEHLPGKGKPIEVPQGAVLNSMLKQANYLPEWLTLQHEIRDQLQKCIESHAAENGKRLDSELNELNAKIKKYNSLVPSSVLQKRLLTRDNYLAQHKFWA